MVPATSSSLAPSSIDCENAVLSSDTPRPTACQPTIRWLSLRATTRTKPSVLSMVIARPLAAKGKLALMQSAPASCGVRPTTTISGSVKQTAGIAAGLKWRRLPLTMSATISPCAIARCASIGSPARSPMAHTLRIEVRHWSSILTARPFMSSSRLSRPHPSVRGRRPTATSTRSASSSDSTPAASRTRTALPAWFMPSTLVPRRTSTPRCLSAAPTGRDNSLS